MERTQEEAEKEFKLAERHEGPSGQEEEWRLLNTEREDWENCTERREGKKRGAGR